ncbi:MAG: DUF4185 domain-containing protein [Bacteroidales bacterium]|nr:DUF4185 domain-containing protein [Bacteroidales bacterium]
MKMRIGIFLLGCLVMTEAASCDDGRHVKENIFENIGNADIAVNFTVNADSVFLGWTVLKDAVHDGFLVTDAAGKNSLRLPGDAHGCVLTHIPYNRPVNVSVLMLDSDKEVGRSDVTVFTDGTDRAMASVLIPDHGSVTGGDGMYSIALPDGRSIFLMGDSYLGTVTNGTRPQGTHMYRNTYFVYDGSSVRAIADGNGPDTSAAVPEGQPFETKWYWPGHGFVVGDRLFIFQELMYQGAEGAWGFRYETTHTLEYSLPDISLVKDSRIPFHGSADIHYGAAALNDGEWLYIYAQVDIENDLAPVTEVHLARTTVDRIYTDWEYYTGAGWSADPALAKPLEGVASVPVSSQFNVFRLRDKYVLFTSDKTFGSGKVYSFVSDAPWGPWRGRRLLYEVPTLKSGWFPYNAMAHPQFEKDGMILMSYNVNTDTFSEQFSNVESYRPRFVWIEIDSILE